MIPRERIQALLVKYHFDPVAAVLEIARILDEHEERLSRLEKIQEDKE